jgi:hypothetical protein
MTSTKKITLKLGDGTNTTAATPAPVPIDLYFPANFTAENARKLMRVVNFIRDKGRPTVTNNPRPIRNNEDIESGLNVGDTISMNGHVCILERTDAITNNKTNDIYEIIYGATTAVTAPDAIEYLFNNMFDNNSPGPGYTRENLYKALSEFAADSMFDGVNLPTSWTNIGPDPSVASIINGLQSMTEIRATEILAEYYTICNLDYPQPAITTPTPIFGSITPTDLLQNTQVAKELYKKLSELVLPPPATGAQPNPFATVGQGPSSSQATPSMYEDHSRGLSKRKIRKGRSRTRKRYTL